VLAQLAAFLGVSMVVIATPGQDTALIIRNTLLGGRRSGVFTALGVSAGQACWTLAASAGLAALLRASEPAFLALRLAGATYLVFLGLQASLGALRGKDDRLSGGLAPPRLVPRAGDLLRGPRIRRALEGLTGAVLVALGLRLAAER
jgi:threonine/homoserine/homoserine lactone efflux protein